MNKKTLLLLKLWLVLTGLSGFLVSGAQSWAPPTYYSEVPQAGTTYYVYNMGANGFLSRGGEWATHAVVSATPIHPSSDDIANWTIDEPSAGNFTFRYSLNGTAVNLPPLNWGNPWLFYAGSWDAWTDGWGSSNWLIAEIDAVNHIHTIQPDMYVGQDKYLGWSTYPQATNRGTADMVFTDKPGGGANTQWKFISQANYDLYQAKVVLDRYLNYAKALGDLDLSSYISAYNSDNIALIEAASDELKGQMAVIDESAAIVNASFETNSLSGWTNAGGYWTQTNDPNWTGMIKSGNVYGEKWTWGNLSGGTLTQTISGLTNGYYQLTVGSFAFQQQGSNPLHTGGFVTAGTKSAEVSAGGDYIIDMVEVTDGTLTIGYKLEGAIACNYTGFDNWRITRYAPGSAIATLADLSVSTGTLTPAFDPEATAYYVLVPDGTTSIDVSATPAIAGATVSGTGSYDVSGGSTSATVSVTSVDGQNTIDYVVDFIVEDPNCFEPLFTDRPNLVSDPELTAISNFAGWGSKSIVYGLEAYCGGSAGQVSGINGGSIDVDLDATGLIKANATYRLKAVVKAVESGNFQIGFWGTGMPDYTRQTSTNDEWEIFDWTFTTGSSVGTDLGMYFNNYGVGGNVGYIDNWELYDISDDATLSSIYSLQGVLSPAFDPEVTEYTLNYYADETSVEIGAIASVSSAKVTGTGVFDVPATDEVTITVTSVDGTTKTYAVKLAPKADDARLSAITTSAGLLDPLFESHITGYNLVVPKGTSTVDITAVTNDPDATYSGGGTIEVKEGITNVELVVTAKDGQTKKIYRINVSEEDVNYAMRLPGGENGRYSNVALPAFNIETLPVTIEMWYKPDVGEDGNKRATVWYSRATEGSPDAGVQYDRWDDVNKIKAVWNGTSTLPQATPIPGKWNHIALVVTEASKTLFINGVASAETGSFSNYDFSTGTYLGWDPVEGLRTLAGEFDEVRVWSAEKTAEDLEANKFLQLSGSEENLLGYWNFDMNHSQIAVDKASGALHGVINYGTYVPSDLAGTMMYQNSVGMQATTEDIQARSANEPVAKLVINTSNYMNPLVLKSLDINIAGTSDMADVDSVSVYFTSTDNFNTDGKFGKIALESETFSISGEQVLGSGANYFWIAMDIADSATLGNVVDAECVAFTLDGMSAMAPTSADWTGNRTIIEYIPPYTLMHSYTFEDGTANDVIGTANGVLEGDATIADGQLSLTGGFVELPGAEINVQAYSALTIESVFRQQAGLGGFTVLVGLGNTLDGWMGVNYLIWQPTRNDNNNSRTSISCGNTSNPWATEDGVDAPKIADDLPHYAVTVLTDTEIKLYIDGELINATSLTGSNSLSSISSALAFIGKSVYPGDPVWKGLVDEVNIFEGELDAETIASRAKTFLGTASHDASLASLTIDQGNLNPTFDPAITKYFVTIPEGTSSISVDAVVADANASIEGLGTVDVSSGSATANVLVTAEDGLTTKTYTIEFSLAQEISLMHSYTFEDGTFDAGVVFDQIGTVDGTIGGTNLTIADGKATVSGATVNSDGWISLDGTALALSTYSAGITLEAYVESGQTLNAGYTMLAYFGTSTPGNRCFWIQPTRSGTETRIETNNGSTTITAALGGTEVDDGLKHHLIAILSATNLRYYIDGVLVAEAATNGADFISTIGTDVANIFRGVDGWNDPNYNASLEEFNIYLGVMDAETITDHSSAYLNSSDARLSALTASEGTVMPGSAENSTHFAVLVPAGSTSVTLTATPFVSSATVGGDGEIDLTAGETTIIVTVTSADETVTREYSVDILFEDADCAASLNPNNIVPDPEMTDLSKYAGWGTKTIVYGFESYCGGSSIKVNGSCGGSLDVDLDATGMLLPNTTYRMRAMVYVGGSGKFKVGWFGTATPAYVIESKQNDMWEMLDTTFTTGEDISNFGMYFNSCEGMNGEVGYIDNWEVWAISSTAALADLTVDGATVDGFDPATFSYSVTVPSGTESVVVAATASDVNAVVEGGGTVDVSSGSGNATVTVTSEDGLSSSSYSIAITVDTNTAVNDIELSSIKVYPTVSAQEFNVAFEGVQPGSIKVYNIAGQLVLTRVAEASIEKIQVQKAGIYLLKIESQGTSKVVKVIKTE